MNFWLRFWKGDTAWLAYSPDFDAITQGDTLEEARAMARDLLVIHLEDTWGEGQKLPNKITPETAQLPAEQAEVQESLWETVEVPPKAVFALSIKRARLAQGRTLKSAAADLGVAPGTYQRWEDPRKFNATFETMAAVAKSFGKTLHVTMK